MATITYYMGFFKYEDSTIWQKTNLNHNKKDLEVYLNNLQYIDKKSVIIKEIELPE